jgi:DNA-binding HxlR family transcriptional regulator
VKRTDRKSRCAVNSALEVVGDPWSLLVVRDIVFYGKHTFGEFLASEERITTSVLADRLAMLVSSGILSKQRNPADKRRELYSLTDAGLALIPVLVELANWGVRYDPEVVENQLWTSKAATDRTGLYQLIQDTVVRGGSVYRGQDSVIEQLQQASDLAISGASTTTGPSPVSNSEQARLRGGADQPLLPLTPACGPAGGKP